MRTKSLLFCSYTLQSDYDIFVITESWLNLDFYSEEFFNPYVYIVYRKDRDAVRTGHEKGGGVLIAVKKSLFCKSISLINMDTLLDQLCVSIKLLNSELFICVSYIPPRSVDEIYDAHVSNIVELYNHIGADDRLCVLGDFNLSDVSWSEVPNSNSFLPSNVNRSFEINLIDSFFSLDLLQINTIYNSHNKMLDLIFLSSDLKFSVCESAFPVSPSTSHHSPLEIEIKFYEYSSYARNDFVRYNYFSCNFDRLTDIFYSLDWIDLLNNPIVGICYDIFLSNIVNVCQNNISLAKPIVHNLPWYTKGLKKLKNLRNKYHKIYKSSNNAIDKHYFKHYEREFNFLNKFLYNQYIMNLNVSVKYNPKRFFNFINSKRKSSSIPLIMNYNSLTSNTISSSLNLFSLYFQSNFNVDSGPLAHFDLNDINSCVDIGSMQISDDDVVNGINKLSNSFNCDNDGLSAFLLKKCSSSLILPLKIIFNKSLTAGYFIQRWKYSSVLPVHKSGNKNNVCNYRPISKLTNVAKIFEHIVYDKLFFSLKRYISIHQHGFMPGRSTTSNLAVFTQFCISSFERGLQVDTIYTDFAKAFDRVPHNLLLLKLSKIGFHSEMLSWFRHYLTGRCSVVSIDGFHSDTFIPSSGIPQGSILGPLLFNIFVNDITSCFKYSQFLLYADDLKIFKQISTLKDISNLQEDLDRVIFWSARNSMPFSVNKCYSMTYHRRRNILMSKYKIKDYTLSAVDEILDLGVVFDVKLCFNNHLNYIIPKAYSMLAFIRRNCEKCFDHYTKKTLFIAFVRSKLEYATFIWAPSAKVHINRVERIQKKFIKFALSFLNFSTPVHSSRIPSYPDKCLLIGMKTLEVRRNVLSINFLHGIIWGFVDCQDLLEVIKINVPSRRLRNNVKFFHIDLHRTDYALNEPLTKALRLFNVYSNQLDLSLPHQHFKIVLNNLLK